MAPRPGLEPGTCGLTVLINQQVTTHHNKLEQLYQQVNINPLLLIIVTIASFLPTSVPLVPHKKIMQAYIVKFVVMLLFLHPI